MALNPKVKLQANISFPGSVYASPPLTLNKTGGNFTFGIDVNALMASLGPVIDPLYVNTSGDTMTGPLILNADPAVPLGAATKQYVDAHSAIPEPPADTLVYGRANTSGTGAWQRAVAVAGDTMTGNLFVGVGGTGNAAYGIFLNGGSGGSGGGYHAFQRNSAPDWYIGHSSALIGDFLGDLLIHNQNGYVPAARFVRATNIVAFTNPPTSPTPAPLDNSNKSATTAYVDRTTREKLTANRDYYVGANIGVVTISIASPAVAAKVAHGLLANDPVVFQVPQNATTATISAANPAVVTMANTFAAGQPVSFKSTGYLPTGITTGVTYYVIAAGLSGSSFQISTTPGGAAINTTAISATFTNASSTITTGANHNAAVGQIIQFAGTSVVNFANATNYWVVSTPAANTMTVSATPTGAAIVAGAVTTNGTLVQNGTHQLTAVGSLPTGVGEGTVYYVSATGLTANSFQFSATPGGASINTSGSVTGSPVYTAYTGNDANSGLGSATRSTSFLTIQKAIDVACALDGSIYAVTINVADGTYLGQQSIKGYLSAAVYTVKGNSSNPSNCVLNAASGGTHCWLVNAGAGPWQVDGFELRAGGMGAFVLGPNASIAIFNHRFGACASSHLRGWSQGVIQFAGPYSVVGPATYHWEAKNLSYVSCQFNTISIFGNPTMTAWTKLTQGSGSETSSNTFNGTIAGKQYDVTVNAYSVGAANHPGNVAGTFATGGQVV